VEVKAMVSDVVSIGDKVELIILDRDEENEKASYKSKVLDFPDYKSAIITMPIVKGRIVPLSVGDRYSLRFFANSGLYECKGVVTDRSNDDNVYILTIEFTSALEKHQRRKYFRLSCVLDTEYYIVTEAELTLRYKLKQDEFKSPEEKEACIEALEQCKRDWQNGIIVDLSGGGVRLTSENLHDIGSFVQMKIQFGVPVKLKADYVSGVIISSEKMTNRVGFYEYRLQFKEVLKEDREAVIKYIFEEEIRQRAKDKNAGSR
jgi:c-di-GMP-binding flagellar brake protein YcgR